MHVSTYIPCVWQYPVGWLYASITLEWEHKNCEWPNINGRSKTNTALRVKIYIHIDIHILSLCNLMYSDDTILQLLFFSGVSKYTCASASNFATVARQRKCIIAIWFIITDYT